MFNMGKGFCLIEFTQFCRIWIELGCRDIPVVFTIQHFGLLEMFHKHSMMILQFLLQNSFLLALLD